MPRRKLAAALGALSLVLWFAPSALGAEMAATEDPSTDASVKHYRLQLDWHPIGLVVPKGDFRLSSFLRMYPAGFPADDYSLHFQPTYGLGNGWEVSAGAMGAQRIGPGGEAIFYALGIQKQLLPEAGSRPAVSVSAYGLAGPHDHHSGAFTLSGTKQVWQRGHQSLFLHAGVKYALFEGDDYGGGDGIRPYVGGTIVLTPHLFLGTEFSPPQPWERANLYAVRLTYRANKWISVGGGIRSNGHRTEPIISLIL